MERVRELLSKKATFEEGVRVLTRAVESEITGGGGKRKEVGSIPLHLRLCCTATLWHCDSVACDSVGL